MAVYYSTRQQRNIGRLRDGKDIRSWIRGGYGTVDEDSYADFALLHRDFGLRFAYYVLRSMLLSGRDSRKYVKATTVEGHQTIVTIVKENIRSATRQTRCDPDEVTTIHFVDSTNPRKNLQPKMVLMLRSFTPSVAAVITISAPQMLLSASLFSLLIAIGAYFGLVWTQDVSHATGVAGNRNIFIFYLVGVVVGFAVYSVSGIIQNSDARTERTIVQDYCEEWLIQPAKRRVIATWGYKLDLDPDSADQLRLQRLNGPPFDDGDKDENSDLLGASLTKVNAAHTLTV